MKYKPGTFVTVPNKEFLRGRSPYLQAVYFWLCSRQDSKSGTCYPSWTTIAREAGTSKRSVAKYIDELIELGILRKQRRVDEHGDLTSNLYQIIDRGGVLPARPVGQPLHEGSAAGADITISTKQNKKEDMSSYDDAPPLSFKKNAIKTQTYLKNEARLNELLANGEFATPKYDFPADGPFDWRYIANRGEGLTPERYMLAVYWNLRNRYESLKQDFDFEMSYQSKDVADTVVKRDLKDARALANCIEFHQLPKLIEIAEDKAWDEKKGEHAWQWKLHTLLKYIEELRE